MAGKVAAIAKPREQNAMLWRVCNGYADTVFGILDNAQCVQRNVPVRPAAIAQRTKLVA